MAPWLLVSASMRASGFLALLFRPPAAKAPFLGVSRLWFGRFLAALAIAFVVPAGAQSLECRNIFDGSILYAIESPLLDHYRGEELGREIEVTNGEHTRKIFFMTRYLNERQAAKYEVFERDGLLVDHRGRPLDSRYLYIYVMNSRGQIFATNEKQVGIFHHSSFVAGQPIAASGEFRIQGGVLQSITNKSGHYQPTWRQARQFIRELERRGIPVPRAAKETFDPSDIAP